MIEYEETSARVFLDNLDALRGKLASAQSTEVVRAMANVFSMMGAPDIPFQGAESFETFRGKGLALFDEYCADARPRLEQEYERQRGEVVRSLQCDIDLLEHDIGGFSWKRICAVMSLIHGNVSLVEKDLEIDEPNAATEQLREGLANLFRHWHSKLTKGQ